MFEFTKMCNEFEKLSAVERGVILTEKSVKVLAMLRLYDEPDIDPVETLATFILGSIVSDGKVDEIDESFIEDIITLCLCVVTIDGKISLKERNYIKKLIKA